jgi:FKBP-type peptidyl-prolyl cis-trans isomerase
MMQKRISVLAVIATAGLLAACGQKNAGSNAPLTTESQKFSYSVGLQIGNSLQQAKSHLDLDALKNGIDDAVGGKPPRLDDAARRDVMTTVSKQLMQEASAAAATAASARTEQGAKAVLLGQKFLADNARKPGVKTTASGLQYEVLSEGKGAHPKATDMVTVNYRGTLINGDEFDSSYARKQPASFPLNQVIPGWTEGVQLMTVGSKYKFYVPAQLGYGEAGAGGKIGPNETLIFEVELLSIDKPQ